MMKPASFSYLTKDDVNHGTIEVRAGVQADLHSINSLIASAIGTWRVADRVKRISLPLYRYHEDDLEDMQIVVAHSGDIDILGIAALEQAYASNIFDGLPTSLLHGIYVAPNLHRSGVGSRLLDKIENLARSQGTVVLLVKARPEALAFFKARGFCSLAVPDLGTDYPHQFFKLL